MVIKKGSKEFSSRHSERNFSFACLVQAIQEKKSPSSCSRNVGNTSKQPPWTFPTTAMISRLKSLHSPSFLPTGNAAVVVPKQEELRNNNNNNRPPPVPPPNSTVVESSFKDEENHSRQPQKKSSRRGTIQADLRKCFHIPPAKGCNRHHRPWRIVQQRNVSLMGSASKRLARRVEAFQKQCVRKMGMTLNHIGFSMGANDHNTSNPMTRLDRIIRSLQQPRFKRGQFVLVCNIPSARVTKCSSQCPTTRPTTSLSAPCSSLSLNTTPNLVNRHGYPRGGGGGGASEEEQQGPYLYVLAEIQRVHCGDHGLGCVPKYTIVRADTEEESWIEEVFMEPILSEQGRLAALKAARQQQQQQQDPEAEATTPSNNETGASVEKNRRLLKQIWRDNNPLGQNSRK